jgi:ankyrin repeat protein
VNALLRRSADPNLQLKKPIIGRHNNLSGDTSLGEGATPLMRAAKANDLVIMRELLEGGADPVLTLADRTNAAMITNSLDAIKLLVEHGVDVNAFNSNGQTIVHNAAGRGANAIIQFAAENGARLDKKDKQGRTPLDIASGAGGGGRGGRGAAGAGPRGGGGNQETARLLQDLIAKNAK